MQAVYALLLAVAGGSGSGGETVLYDFHADWCVPCQRAMPLVDKLASEGLPIRKVNIDREPGLARRFGVRPIPCFVMVVNGQEVDRVVGVPSEGKLRQMLARPHATAANVQATQGNAAPRKGGRRSSPPRLTTQPRLPEGPAAADIADLPWSKQDSRTASPPVTRSTEDGDSPTGRGNDAQDAELSLDDRLLAATVRLRVDDPDGQAFSHGTGTIIDARDGEALIVTCAHLFREAGKEGRVRVDMFCPGGKHGVPGRVIGYDLKRDVALVAFRPGVKVIPTPVAGLAYQAREGETVCDVGCSRGDDPTVRHSRITNISESNFPPNIQSAGQPVQGRSGGGLFNEKGEIIGVCFAADPQDDEGLYATLRSIYAELDRNGLSEIYQRNAIDAPVESRLADNAAPSMPKKMPSKTPQVTLPMDLPLPGGGIAANLSAKELAALAAMQTAASEVVITIRGEQGQPDREIVLPKASPELLRQLAQQQAAALSKHLTAEKTDVAPPPRRRLPWEPGGEGLTEGPWNPDWQRPR